MNDRRDDEIVALFLARDEEAIGRTQALYGSFLLGVATGIVGNESDGEECVNDALFAVWNHIPPDRPQSFRAYVTKIVRNLSLMRYREKNGKKRASSEYALCLDDLQSGLENGQSVEKAFDDRELSSLINKFVGSLPKQRRYIFVSRYCLSAPISEIARESGKSESLIFHDLSLMKNQLKEMLEKEGFL